MMGGLVLMALKNLAPSLPACFPNKNNAPKTLILPYSRPPHNQPTSRHGEGAWPATLAALGSGRAGSARQRRLALRAGRDLHPSGAGRAWNTKTAWDAGLARAKAGGDARFMGQGVVGPALPSGASVGEAPTTPTAGRFRKTTARSVGLSRNGINPQSFRAWPGAPHPSPHLQRPAA